MTHMTICTGDVNSATKPIKSLNSHRCCMHFAVSQVARTNSQLKTAMDTKMHRHIQLSSRASRTNSDVLAFVICHQDSLWIRVQPYCRCQYYHIRGAERVIHQPHVRSRT